MRQSTSLRGFQTADEGARHTRVGVAVPLLWVAIASFSGCAAPLARSLAGADAAVEAAAADDGIPSAAQAGLAFTDSPTAEK